MLQEIASADLRVQVNPKGAELCSVTGKDGGELLWPARPDVWPRHAPVLFPIVGKLKNNRYRFDGKEYELAQHGFARDLDFRLKESGTSGCEFELRSSDETKINYPFDFSLRIGYALMGNILTTAYTLLNTGDKALYFSIGAHPGFCCPLEPGIPFEDHYLLFDKNDLRTTALNNGLRTSSHRELQLSEGRLFLSGTLFDQDALVFEGGQVKQISLCAVGSQKRVTLRCKGWPWFGIWSKKGCREFLCLEPWFGVADRENASGELTDKEGMICLEAGSAFTCAFELQFD